jgi:preprotein translocase subunit SecG
MLSTTDPERNRKESAKPTRSSRIQTAGTSKKRLATLAKIFLVICIIGGVLGPADYYRINSYDRSMPFGVFEFTAIMIACLCAIAIVLAYFISRRKR